jgi:2-amino-1-hydroxyethylphosphonate dioxygenase (glycine-forming)
VDFYSKTMSQAIEFLRELFTTKGQETYGEGVTILQHSVQSGELAEEQGFGEDIVAAAFLHDVGHFFDNNEQMGNLGTRSHEKIGAEFLRSQGFPEKIALLVEGHVQAKRYLTFKDPDYEHRLSEASRRTLIFQGGKMTATEARDFEQSPLFNLSVQMRKWDEAAKIPDKPANHKLNHFLQICKSLPESGFAE